MEVAKLLPMQRFSIDMFSYYSSRSRILYSDGKQNTALASTRGVRIVALSISSHKQKPSLLFSNIVGSLYF